MELMNNPLAPSSIHSTLSLVMTDTVNISNDVPEIVANLVPVHIEYSGSANTQEYFTDSKIREDGHEVAYFRGCKLVGNNVDFANNYTAYVMNKSESLIRIQDNGNNEFNGLEETVKSVNSYNPVGKFTSINVYGHDAPLSQTNQWQLVNEWHDISEIIHS
ncbi:ribonuclease H2 non-catalytic subunit-domain-containing protein [Scheffersomyces amazonensis]|uniref:ribonuclease H2 non-catalytic subunit-domain-containing protein n=1 Tax=Scheffersomyces amazonensis TaxID=1078765 RepID=UPI00315D4B12